ncbi:hypothetical protein N7457_007351 [Penicillium paradoxum]|uniref:uncharacterized protein n=1 Tax=Penicillium paradoxum TaxID=176176 RepID=UPI002547C065|nr:uncharacterized protein N7457_007351 [Penicillium paradoxum]KAJ5779631.1 hypothetical protein N7457_007351 [Penicillium paradoxum]
MTRRARSTPTDPRRTKEIDPIPPPLGDLIVTIHHADIESGRDQEKDTARITNSHYLTSYNWLSGRNPSIIVPGEPPQWSPPSDVPKLRQDNGRYYRDNNAGRYPNHPLEPMIQAILTDRPEFPVTDVDIVGCENTLGNLLGFVRGKDKPFRMLVEVLDTTVFFIRRQNSPIEKYNVTYGYGHTFPKVYTTWSASVAGSDSHQRVVEYDFADLKCLMRFKADGFLSNLIPETNELTKAPVYTSEIAQEEALPSIEDATISNMQPAPTNESLQQLGIANKGRHIPQCAIFDLKTRSHNKKPADVLREEMARLWMTQTPSLVLAFHKANKFGDIQIHDVREDVEQWEDDHQPTLAKFACLLRMIVGFVRSMEDGKIEIEHEEGERVLNVRAQGGVVSGVLSPGDYCDVYLTHDSMSVRKAHNSGRNHLRNVVDYYQQIGQEKAQSVIDSITSSYAAEGQQVPNMMPPGAFPPPFGFPGRPGMPPPPFGIPPPGAPGAPGMLPRMFHPPPFPAAQGFPRHPGPHPANHLPFHPIAPGAHGLPFPPPFPNAGTPPTGGFPPPLPNMPHGANLPIPPPGGFPNFPIPPPGAAGFPPMPGQPGMGPGGPAQIPTGPRGSEGYPPPPGGGPPGGPPGGMDQRW